MPGGFLQSPGKSTQLSQTPHIFVTEENDATDMLVLKNLKEVLGRRVPAFKAQQKLLPYRLFQSKRHLVTFLVPKPDRLSPIFMREALIRT